MMASLRLTRIWYKDGHAVDGDCTLVSMRNDPAHDELMRRLKQSSEELRGSQSRIRTLINTIPVGLFITDQSGVVESASPAALNLFRCNPPDLHSRSLQDLFVFHGSLAETLGMANSNQAKEVTALRPDGSQFPASIRISSFSGSKLPNLLVVVEDVSAEHELEQLKQEFLSMMTHDLRTPLTSLRCFLELISEGVFIGKDEELRVRSKATIDTTTRLINMINSLLDLHKLEAGRLNLRMVVVPIHSIVKQSVESLVPLAQSRGIPLLVADFCEELLVDADENYSVQVLINLLSNALKFSDTGSPVAVSIEEIDGFVRITVSDKGRGIPKEFQSRLFNRFEQARISDARVLGGTGLGLAISKAIVEEQGGNIGVESEPGLGCDFWFTLRRAAGRLG